MIYATRPRRLDGPRHLTPLGKLAAMYRNALTERSTS